MGPKILDPCPELVLLCQIMKNSPYRPWAFPMEVSLNSKRFESPPTPFPNGLFLKEEFALLTANSSFMHFLFYEFLSLKGFICQRSMHYFT